MTKISKNEFKFDEAHTKSYPILYNGRRVLILDSSSDERLGLGHEIYIWDKRLCLEMGVANKLADGTYLGVTFYGPHELEISGENLRELAADCLSRYLWTMSH